MANLRRSKIGVAGMGGGQMICHTTHEPAPLIRRDLRAVINALWAHPTIEVLLFGNRLTGITRPADKAELAKNLLLVGARFSNKEPFPNFAHYIVTAICKQILWRHTPVIQAVLVTTLAALANAADMRDVPRPKFLETEQKFTRVVKPPSRLSIGSRSNLAKAQNKKVVLA